MISRKRFSQFLSGKGLKVTSQRLSIFDAAAGCKDHFTAETLLDYSRLIDRSISRATVYRTLSLLTESGAIREVDVGRDNKYYRLNREEKPFQAQVICGDCEKIFEIDAPFMEWYGKALSEKLGLQIVRQRLQVEVICPRRQKGLPCSHPKVDPLPLRFKS